MPTPWRLPPPAPRLSAIDQVLRTVAPGLPLVHRSITEALYGPVPVNARGTALDLDTHLVLGIEGSPPEEHHPLPIRRENMRRGIALIDGPKVPVHATIDTVIAGHVPCRIYRPSGARDLPWMMYIHGGGWVTGDLDTHDRICRRLCREGELVVAAIDYRLAPEDPFPAALQDTEDAWCDLSESIALWGGDSLRGCVGGDSAGANLAAVLCQRLRDDNCVGAVPQMQLLIYPVIDFRRLDASHKEFASGFLLSAERIDLYKGMYAAPDDHDPCASPIRHRNLADLPPALVVTAGFDPLRDEAERYVHALRAAGNTVGWMEGAGLVHGFVQMDCVVRAAEAVVKPMIQVVREGVRTGQLPASLCAATPPCSTLPEPT